MPQGNSITIDGRRLQAVGERVWHVVQLAMEKAIAHHADPASFPIPSDPNTLERLMLNCVGAAVVGEAEDIVEAEPLMIALQPDLAVVDMLLPGVRWLVRALAMS